VAKFSVYNKDGKESSTIDLPDEIFGVHVNQAVIHQAVLMYHNNLREGQASTKVRGDVSGGGKKPWRQKGTGRARQGSIRSPLWHKGGVVFGPHPRDFGYNVPKKIKAIALRETLNAKFKDENLHCVDDLKESLEKTKEFAKILKALKLQGKVLALLDGSDPSVVRVSKNIPYFQLMRAQDVTAFDILRNKNLLVTKTAFKTLLERVTKS
jgi:large subunit ribosomal protein L4